MVSRTTYVSQVEVIDCTETCDYEVGVPFWNSIHQSAAGTAEVVGHGFSWANGAWLAESLQILATPEMLDRISSSNDVGCEHRRGDLAAVRTITDKYFHQTGGFGWLRRYQHRELNHGAWGTESWSQVGIGKFEYSLNLGVEYGKSGWISIWTYKC